MNDGDWICSDANCGNINFARRLTCYRCNKEKPDTGKICKKKLGTEIGKSAAEKSRGLFNADDWQCNKCANVNWARRTSCNVCNAPKFGEVEARTGYGGGYNERGVVEYRRRDSSSSDEFDEFGRRKRKRKSETEKTETQDKVGTTEGPVFKMLPPMLQKGAKMDQMSESASDLRPHEKVSGSLSDGSVCDFPPLSKMAFRKYQIQNQTNYHRQDHMLPNYRNNGFQTRRRYSSIGDKDHTGSSGYETGSKRDRQGSVESPVAKGYNPVMENMVSSTNNEIIYKFPGKNPAESFEISYSVEERVRAAAMAIAFNNLKVTCRKFENLYDKPAPDFKTIFAWRQRLLITGCLVDSHVDLKRDLLEKPPPYVPVKNACCSELRPQVKKIPNPDEIPISVSSDSDNEEDKNPKPPLSVSRHRSASVETLLISGTDTNHRAAGSTVSTADEQNSQARSHSRSTQHKGGHSSSSDSRASDYPDTDSDKNDSKSNSNKTKTNIPVRQSVQDSDSDSISYDSEEDDFLSRVYKGKKQKRKTKKRSTPALPAETLPFTSQPINQPFQGYSTMKKAEISPLATGNIYAPNVHSMAVKMRENPLADIDACSVEYVPTKLCPSAQKNYQTFKDNVRKKGYWAKANGQSVNNKQKPIKSPISNPQNTSGGSFWSKQHLTSMQNSSATVIPGMQDTTIEHINKEKMHMSQNNNMGSFWSNSSKQYMVNNNNTVSKNAAISVTKQIPAKGNFWANFSDEGSSKRKYYMDSKTQNIILDSSKHEANLPGISDTPVNINLCSDMKESGKRTLPEIINEPIRKRKLPNEVMLNTTKEPRANSGLEVAKKLLITDKSPDLQSVSENSNCLANIGEEPTRKRKRRSNEIVLPGVRENENDKFWTGDPTSEQVLSMDPIINCTVVAPSLDLYIVQNQDNAAKHAVNNDDEFANDDFNNFLAAESFTSFDKLPLPAAEKSSEDTSCVFELVQSSNSTKNKSIMDIFNSNIQVEKSPERNNDLEKYDSVRKTYETEWDDDDEALYGTDTAEVPSNKRTPSPPSIASVRAQSPLTISHNNIEEEREGQNTSTPNTSTINVIGEKSGQLIDVLKDFQANKELDLSNIPIPPTKSPQAPVYQSNLINKPQAIPTQVSNEIIGLSEEIISSKITVSKNISPSKKVHVIESITIKPNDNLYITNDENMKSKETIIKDFDYNQPSMNLNDSPKIDAGLQNQTSFSPKSSDNFSIQPSAPQIDLSNLLSGINTNTLLLALQNLQQISQNTQNDTGQTEEHVDNMDTSKDQVPVETINLTNDEDWENESNNGDYSIEKQLEKLDGNTGDTPFLSDIFDPGPVVVPPHLAKKVNINLKKPEEKIETHPPCINENAPVIGNFKSFALPKPILLNKLKVTMKVPDKTPARKTKKKSKASASKNEEEEDEEEESGDEADLSKYDLIGSDEEQGTSKPDEENNKDGATSKDGSDSKDKNGKRESPEDTNRKRRSSSSSSTSSSSSSSSSQTSGPKNKFDDFNLNSEREGSPRGRKSRSRSPLARPGARRKSRDSRSAGESRSSRDKDHPRERDRRDKSRDKPRGDRKERRYSRDGNHYSGGRNRHR